MHVSSTSQYHLRTSHVTAVTKADTALAPLVNQAPQTSKPRLLGQDPKDKLFADLTAQNLLDNNYNWSVANQPIPDMNTLQRKSVLNSLFKKVKVRIDGIYHKGNYVAHTVHFTLMELFRHLLAKGREPGAAHLNIKSIEISGDGTLSTLPDLANVLMQGLLNDPDYKLPADLLKVLEGAIHYCIHIPCDSPESFIDMKDALLQFIAEKACQDFPNTPIIFMRNLIETTSLYACDIPELFSLPYVAKFPLVTQTDEGPKTINFVISQQTGDTSPFCNAKLSVPIMDFIAPPPERSTKVLACDQPNAIWQTCLDQMTGCLRLKTPLPPGSKLNGCFELMHGYVTGLRPLLPGTEKTLLSASFEAISHYAQPEIVQQRIAQYIDAPHISPWDITAAYQLEKLAAGNFDTAIALLMQTSLALSKNGHAQHVAPLWEVMQPHLEQIRAQPVANEPASLWQLIYQFMSTAPEHFGTLTALLEVNTFLSLCQKSEKGQSTHILTSGLATQLTISEDAPAFRLTDGITSLYFPVRPTSAWQRLYAEIPLTAAYDSLKKIDSLLDSNDFPQGNDASIIGRNQQALNIDYTAIATCVGTHVTNDPFHKQLAAKGLLACHVFDQETVSWRLLKGSLTEAFKTLPDGDEKQEFILNALSSSSKTSMARSYANELHRTTAADLVWAHALLENIDPTEADGDAYQAHQLWVAYHKKNSSLACAKIELEIAKKLAAYRPDLAADLLGKLNAAALIDIDLHANAIIETICRMCRSAKKPAINLSDKHISTIAKLGQGVLATRPSQTAGISFENLTKILHARLVLQAKTPQAAIKTAWGPFDEELLQAVIARADKSNKNAWLILDACQLAMATKKTELAAKTLLLAIKMELTAEQNQRLKELLISIFDPSSGPDEVTLFNTTEQLLSSTTIQKKLKEHPTDALQAFMPLLQLLATHHQLPHAAPNLLRLSLQLCDPATPSAAYLTCAHLAMRCIENGLSHKSALFKTIRSYQAPLLKALAEDPETHRKFAAALAPPQIQPLPTEPASTTNAQDSTEPADIITRELKTPHPDVGAILDTILDETNGEPDIETGVKLFREQLKALAADSTPLQAIHAINTFTKAIYDLSITPNIDKRRLTTGIHVWKIIRNHFACLVEKGSATPQNVKIQLRHPKTNSTSVVDGFQSLNKLLEHMELLFDSIIASDAEFAIAIEQIAKIMADGAEALIWAIISNESYESNAKLMPAERFKIYQQTIQDSLIQRIKRQAEAHNGHRADIPYQYFELLATREPLERIKEICHELISLNTFWSITISLHITAGLLSVDLPAQSQEDCHQWIEDLLTLAVSNYPCQTKELVTTCLTRARAVLAQGKKEAIWELLLEKLNSDLASYEIDSNEQLEAARSLLKLILTSPATFSQNNKIFELEIMLVNEVLSDLCIYDLNFDWQKIADCKNFLVARASPQHCLEKHLDQNIHLDLLERICDALTDTPQHLTQQLAALGQVIRLLPKQLSAPNLQKLSGIFSIFASKSICDSCFDGNTDTAYEKYSKNMATLARVMAENTFIDAIPHYLPMLFSLPTEIAKGVKKSLSGSEIQTFYKMIQTNFEQAKSDKDPSGFAHFKRLSTLVCQSFNSYLLETFQSYLDIMKLLMNISLDYVNGDDANKFSKMAQTITMLLGLKGNLSAEQSKDRSKLIVEWCNQLLSHDFSIANKAGRDTLNHAIKNKLIFPQSANELKMLSALLIEQANDSGTPPIKCFALQKLCQWMRANSQVELNSLYGSTILDVLEQQSPFLDGDFIDIELLGQTLVAVLQLPASANHSSEMDMARVTKLLNFRLALLAKIPQASTMSPWRCFDEGLLQTVLTGVNTGKDAALLLTAGRLALSIGQPMLAAKSILAASKIDLSVDERRSLKELVIDILTNAKPHNGEESVLFSIAEQLLCAQKVTDILFGYPKEVFQACLPILATAAMRTVTEFSHTLLRLSLNYCCQFDATGADYRACIPLTVLMLESGISPKSALSKTIRQHKSHLLKAANGQPDANCTKLLELWQNDSAILQPDQAAVTNHSPANHSIQQTPNIVSPAKQPIDKNAPLKATFARELNRDRLCLKPIFNTVIKGNPDSKIITQRLSILQELLKEQKFHGTLGQMLEELSNFATFIFDTHAALKAKAPHLRAAVSIWSAMKAAIANQPTSAVDTDSHTLSRKSLANDEVLVYGVSAANEKFNRALTSLMQLVADEKIDKLYNIIPDRAQVLQKLMPAPLQAAYLKAISSTFIQAIKQAIETNETTEVKIPNWLLNLSGQLLPLTEVLDLCQEFYPIKNTISLACGLVLAEGLLKRKDLGNKREACAKLVNELLETALSNFGTDTAPLIKNCLTINGTILTENRREDHWNVLLSNYCRKISMLETTDPCFLPTCQALLDFVIADPLKFSHSATRFINDHTVTLKALALLCIYEDHFPTDKIKETFNFLRTEVPGSKDFWHNMRLDLLEMTIRQTCTTPDQMARQLAACHKIMQPLPSKWSKQLSFFFHEVLGLLMSQEVHDSCLSELDKEQYVKLNQQIEQLLSQLVNKGVFPALPHLYQLALGSTVKTQLDPESIEQIRQEIGDYLFVIKKNYTNSQQSGLKTGFVSFNRLCNLSSNAFKNDYFQDDYQALLEIITFLMEIAIDYKENDAVFKHMTDEISRQLCFQTDLAEADFLERAEAIMEWCERLEKTNLPAAIQAAQSLRKNAGEAKYCG